MPERVASCSCGQLTATCSDEPSRISVCHCYACQKRTGSAFAAQARFSRSAVAVHGAEKTWARVGDDGGMSTLHFCPTCGATVYYEGTWMPDSIAIALGAFADPSFPAPTIAVYDERRHPWVTLAMPAEP